MLNIHYEHFYGSQEKHDLQLVKLSLDKNISDIEALENGWLICNREWYACRSTRIRVDNYKSIKQVSNSVTYQFTTYDLEPIKKIYKEYRDYKNFNEEYDIFTDPDRSLWLIVKDDGIPVAFTKFIVYQEGLESQFTCWNYHKPKMELGKAIVDMEIWYAKTQGLSHLYIGQGYEKGSIYKSKFPGFEWWTGSEWSTDVEKYKELCSRDSTINTIDDITRAYNATYNS
jgi:arginyl-tRNA--protein-N-Asp/Glu arginylyltransferase